MIIDYERAWTDLKAQVLSKKSHGQRDLLTHMAQIEIDCRVPEELRAFLAQSFAKWQLPDAFVFLSEIPRTSVGKFKKIALREQFANWNWE